MAANYALSSPALALAPTSWSLLVGAKDGTLTMLALVEPRREEESRALVQGLPSRTGQAGPGIQAGAGPLVRSTDWPALGSTTNLLLLLLLPLISSLTVL